MLMCGPTLGFQGTAKQNVDHSPLDHRCQTCGLEFVLRVPRLRL